MSIKDNIVKLRLPPGGDPEAAGRAARAARPVPRYDEWIDRDIPPPDLALWDMAINNVTGAHYRPHWAGQNHVGCCPGHSDGERWQLPEYHAN